MLIKTQYRFAYALILFAVFAASCSNDPYRPGESEKPTYFYSYPSPPTKLDPTTAYYTHEGRIVDQIYEPPFTYHYLKRPYEIMPLTAREIPSAVYYDKTGKIISEEDPAPELVGRVEYTVRIKKGIMYQNHPCFAKNDQNEYIYRNIDPAIVEEYEYPSKFKHQGTRELKAVDYAIQIRRLADPRRESPVFSALAGYIKDMGKLQETFKKLLEQERARRKDSAGSNYNMEKNEANNPIDIDYMSVDFTGFQVLDDYTFKIVLNRKYPQILYWMCMHFFGPVPQEALDFYNEPAIAGKQFSLNRCPIGTGPYYIETFRPNEMIVMDVNPNYHDDVYPSEGNIGDKESGLLADAGKKIPFITRQVRMLEKEDIPDWSKFLQGYYDISVIYNDVFDKAINVSPGGDSTLSEVMKAKGISLVTDTDPSFWYTAVNMLDAVIGGYEPEKKRLRQAMTIALDYNEYLDIFMNSRGLLAHGPVPPGIFGYRGGKEGTNPFTDEWDPIRERHVRKPIEKARELMKQAGYPGGIGSDGKQLTLYFDHSQGGETFFRARFEWTKNRLALIGILLKERATDLSRYRQKKLKGNWQIASGGWIADYPDPENFLFLFYGPNGKVKTGGPNMNNYENAEFDKLFREMESMQNSPRRQEIINKMTRILQEDAPAVWQYYPVAYSLTHEWMKNVKPHRMSYNVIKYRKADASLRKKRQEEWNQPIYTPIYILLAIFAVGLVPATISLRRREKGS